jgi:diguanylate cyclase
MQFEEEPDDAPDGQRAARPWLVLVVDDDRDVHDATRLALGGERLHGRPIEIVDAFSAAEARKLLDSGRFDLLLLDIIMETADAGLVLARQLTTDARHAALKVLVRTGQPGFWQDDAARRMPGVHGYVSKAGLTRASLLDTLATLLPAGT